MKSATYNILIRTGIAAICLNINACVTNPVTGKPEFTTVSEQREIQLGLAAKARFLRKSPSYYDADLIHYVNKIGQRIAKHSHRPDLNYTFTILDSPSINAHALAGGHIFITRGLLAHIKNEAELAAFLGHEIAHVAARHGAKTLTRRDLTHSARLVIFNWLAFTKQAKSLANKTHFSILQHYQPEYELVADRLSAQYLTASGYNPNSLTDSVSFLSQLADFREHRRQNLGLENSDTHRLYNLHPESQQRLQHSIETTSQINTGKWRDNRTEIYSRLINNINFGYSQRFGIAVNNAIYYLPHNLKINLPKNWKIKQKGYEYLAVAPDKNDAIKLTILLPSKVSPKKAVEMSITQNNARPFGKKGSLLNSKIENDQGKKFADLALFAYNDSVLLAINAYSDKANSLNHKLLAIEKTLTTIPSDQRHLGKTRKLRIINARPGDTYSSLAKKSRLGDIAEQYLRLLNRAWPDGEIQAGTKIKIIE